jgi:uncharacterized protein with GYD domain
MALYIMVSTLTGGGRKTIKNNPARIEQVNEEIEKMGARVLAQSAVLGRYDFISVLEAPDNGVMARVSIEPVARGTIQIMTLPVVALPSKL